MQLHKRRKIRNKIKRFREDPCTPVVHFGFNNDDISFRYIILFSSRNRDHVNYCFEGV